MIGVIAGEDMPRSSAISFMEGFLRSFAMSRVFISRKEHPGAVARTSWCIDLVSEINEEAISDDVAVDIVNIYNS
jgi:hypothetical protein